MPDSVLPPPKPQQAQRVADHWRRRGMPVADRCSSLARGLFFGRRRSRHRRSHEPASQPPIAAETSRSHAAAETASQNRSRRKTPSPRHRRRRQDALGIAHERQAARSRHTCRPAHRSSSRCDRPQLLEASRRRKDSRRARPARAAGDRIRRASRPACRSPRWTGSSSAARSTSDSAMAADIRRPRQQSRFLANRSCAKFSGAAEKEHDGKTYWLADDRAYYLARRRR